MKLSTIISELSGVEAANFREQEIDAICADSRECGRGSVFVAISGSRHDGAEFIPEAHSRGARAFVVSSGAPEYKDSTYIFSENPRKTLAELCALLCSHPERRMTFVGITGTKGKTTTSVILSKILDGIGVKNLVIGTLGVLGKSRVLTRNTTPDPTVIFPVLRDALCEGIGVCIIEVSSQALKDFRVFGIPFFAVGFTGMGFDHVGEYEHPTFSDYIRSKRSLFTDYGAVRAVVNGDDDYSLYMSSQIRRVIKCGFSEESGIVIRDFRDDVSGSHFSLNGVSVYTALPGKYNATNTAIAMALAREVSGVSFAEAARYVKGLGVAGRFERVKIGNKNVIVDYAHNRESFIEIISLCRRLFSGKIICVFGSVGERSLCRRRELAACAEEYADFSVITSDNPGFELPLSICADIYSAFKDKTKAKIIVERGAAISYAINEAKCDDAVLLLGRGHEAFINLRDTSIPFSDSEFARRAALSF